MERIEHKIDGIIEDLNEVRVTITKLEGSYDRSVEILDRLTLSVEHHIKRTDTLQELVSHIRLEQELVKKDLEAQMDKTKLIFYVLACVGAVILGLEQLGVFNKLL